MERGRRGCRKDLERVTRGYREVKTRVINGRRRKSFYE